MVLPSTLRRPWLIAGVLLCGVGLSLWLNLTSNTVDIPTLSQERLARLEDTSEDRHYLLAHLAGRLLRGDRFAPWTELDRESQHVWATLIWENELESGTGALLREIPPGEPDLGDVVAAYEAIGAGSMAALFDRPGRALREGPRPPERKAMAQFDRAYHDLISEARAARIAYLRQHLADIAGR